jgi:hypothetical protein
MIYSKSHPKNSTTKSKEDWDALYARLIAKARETRWKSMTAYIPPHSDPRIMRGVSEGIHPGFVNSFAKMEWKPVLRAELGVIAEEMPGSKIQGHLLTRLEYHLHTGQEAEISTRYVK